MADFSVDFSPIGKLGQVYQQAQRQRVREQALSRLGQGSGPLDYATTARALLGAGDTEGGLALARLAEAATERARQQQNADRSFGFQQTEATRAQTNADRTFGLAKTEANRKETTVTDQVSQRKLAAESMGLKPDHPAYQSFVLTGKMPREDAQPLTATDKKAILEADEGVLAANQAIEALKKAKELSPAAMGNPIASRIAPIGAFFGNETSEKTVELDNTVISNALSQLKAIFGGAPTEGERKILLDIQGSSGMPDAVRQKVYDRAIAMAENRLKFNQQRAQEMRGGSFYKPLGSAKPPDGAISALRANRSLAAEFDAKYGAGAAAKVLGGP